MKGPHPFSIIKARVGINIWRNKYLHLRYYLSASVFKKTTNFEKLVLRSIGTRPKVSEPRSVLLRRKLYFDGLKEVKFTRWKHFIESRTLPRDWRFHAFNGSLYKRQDYKEIVSRYREKAGKEFVHAVTRFLSQQNFPRAESSNCLILVHPLYPIIRSPNLAFEEVHFWRNYYFYELLLDRILLLAAEKQYKVVMFDTPENVVLASRYYFGLRAVTNVILTEHSSGKPLRRSDLSELRGVRTCTLLGNYAGRCVDDVIKLFTQKVKIRVISDLVLNRPITPIGIERHYRAIKVPTITSKIFIKELMQIKL